MKFIGLKENIVAGMLIASRFSQPRGNLPILSNVYLQVKKSGLIIKATNLESGVIIEVRGMGEQEGDFTVSAKLISDYLLSVPEEKIELSVQDKKLKITTEKCQTQMNGIEAVDFPILPEVEDNEPLTVETQELSQALSRTLFVVSPQEMRQELSGLFFQFQNNNLIIAGTDTFRLAEQKIKYNGSLERSAIIPHKTLQEVLRICEQSKEKNTRIVFGEGEVLFQMGNIKVFSRLIEGQYPDYQAIIPNQTNTAVSLMASELLQAVKTAGLFSQNGLFDVSLRFDPKKQSLVISSKRNEVGEHSAELPASISGLAAEMFLNYKYLIDCLSRIQNEDIELLIASESQPIKIKPKSEKDYLYLIMPIKR